MPSRIPAAPAAAANLSSINKGPQQPAPAPGQHGDAPAEAKAAATAPPPFGSATLSRMKARQQQERDKALRKQGLADQRAHGAGRGGIPPPKLPPAPLPSVRPGSSREPLAPKQLSHQQQQHAGRPGNGKKRVERDAKGSRENQSPNDKSPDHKKVRGRE